MKVSEILRNAKELIGAPDKWTQGKYARNDVGIPCPIPSPYACSFCTIGAVERTIIDAKGPLGDCDAYDEAITILQRCCFGIHITEFNDSEFTTHADIMHMFDKAIKFAERNENENI